MKICFILLFGLLPFISLCQSSDPTKGAPDDFEWLTTLAEKGVDMTKDSIIVSKEFQALLQDEQSRAIIFPQT
jgi:hypothetical protein